MINTKKYLLLIIFLISSSCSVKVDYENDDGNKIFGWFEIYHGDKEGVGEASEGIRNYLQSFLDSF